ncbi:ABC transporter permease [Helicobacter kayseriensis]|uniref:ABC transporter permease n=1 Tax=Helicobacter kayseriensis TaxID=2905877 RepID=UPI001E5BE11D|nr:ABC transporter permease [Helicobacter kayseriensis]MCE3047732.1 ABC transporter permease [Helicobacter kayseriensis]MCE3049117.1 ABC transporter permease [Helicobacter kayseriensis]
MKFWLCFLLVICLFVLFFPIKEDVILLNQAKLPPSPSHWFGTDLLGRDLFLRIVSALKVSFLVGIGASSLAFMFAVCYVMFFHFFMHSLGVRIIEIFLALPSLMLVMFVQSFLNGGILTMIVVIASGHWALIAKVLDSEILKIEQQDYYQCSRMLGVSRFRALWSEILPACVNVMVVLWILNFAHAIGNEATLSFFGLGIEPSKASLGNILADSAKAIFIGGWWMIVFPVLALMMMILPMLFVANDMQKRTSVC